MALGLKQGHWLEFNLGVSLTKAQANWNREVKERYQILTEWVEGGFSSLVSFAIKH